MYAGFLTPWCQTERRESKMSQVAAGQQFSKAILNLQQSFKKNPFFRGTFENQKKNSTTNLLMVDVF